MTVQEKLKKLRREKHFSDKDVAEILGMKLNSYSRLEHGIGKIGSFLKNKLGLLYDKDPDYFVDDPEIAPEDDRTSETIVESVSEPEIADEIIAEPISEPEIADKIISEPEPVFEPEVADEIIAEPEPAAESDDDTPSAPQPEKTDEIPSENESVPEPEITEDVPSEPDPDIELKPNQEVVTVETGHPATEGKQPDVTIEFQYAGKAVLLSEIIDRTKEACGNNADKIDIYIKPEDDRVYFVHNGKTGDFEI